MVVVHLSGEADVQVEVHVALEEGVGDIQGVGEAHEDVDKVHEGVREGTVDVHVGVGDDVHEGVEDDGHVGSGGNLGVCAVVIDEDVAGVVSAMAEDSIGVVESVPSSLIKHVWLVRALGNDSSVILAILAIPLHDSETSVMADGADAPSVGDRGGRRGRIMVFVVSDAISTSAWEVAWDGREQFVQVVVIVVPLTTSGCGRVQVVVVFSHESSFCGERESHRSCVKETLI